MSPIEILAAFFGFVSVWLTIRQHIGCWPTGIIQVILYISIFFEARLYSDMLLQVFYVFLLAYGWYTWVNGKTSSGELPVTVLPVLKRFFWIQITLIGTLILGYIMKTNTRADFAYLDAWQTVMSLIAQYLMSFKILESWLLWIAVDILSVGIYYVKGLYPTTLLYGMFLIMAFMGFFAWQKAFREASLSSPLPAATTPDKRE
ncbi:MAG: nicotinamide mononucleotide transporter [Candidatus Riflebacteria bacterium]|nr:nicotinamide mononucleotide transporter [Candidatus Riflebacteria bacterium]